MKLSAITEGSFEDLFGPDEDRPTIIDTGPPRQQRYIIELYRGFDVDLSKLKRQDGYLILSPAKSEQGLIWFTHNLIRGYDPIDYVKGRGAYLLTYPLHCVRHFQEIHWSDGTTSTRVPDEILELTEPTENCRYHMGIELPHGWVFSYKTEKFIGCSVELKITPDMLTRQ